MISPMYCVMQDLSNNTYEYNIIINHANIYIYVFILWVIAKEMENVQVPEMITHGN